MVPKRQKKTEKRDRTSKKPAPPASPKRTPLQIAMNNAMREKVAKFASSIRDVEGVPFESSCYVRDLLRFDMALWEQGPYTIVRSSNFLLVTRTGTFVFHRVEDLKLNQSLEKVSAKIDMKHDKIRYYLDEARKAHRSVKTIEDAWALNLFACKVPHRGGSDPVYVQTDPRGMTSKCAEFAIRMAQGFKLTLETVVILRDYVQHYGDDCDDAASESNEPPDNLKQDEANIDIEIPTQQAEFVVVVDKDLYRDDPRFHEDSELPLTFSLKTMRGAPFADGVLPVCETGYDRGLVKKVVADLSAKESHDRMAKGIDDVKSAIERYGDHVQGSSHPLMKRLCEDISKLKELDTLPYKPQKGAFFQLNFAHCSTGMRLAVNWLKPMRPRP